jgi:hypothetical protein
LMDPQDVGRPGGPGQTCSVSWDLDPDKLIRPRSADPIKACGHYAAPIGRTHDRKRPLLFITPKVLADRGPSTHATPGPNSVTLPEVAVFTPYSNCGIGPRVSSFGTIRTEHYEVPPGFDANVPLHPYTSGIGPRPGPGDKGTSMAGNKPPLHHNR